VFGYLIALATVGILLLPLVGVPWAVAWGAVSLVPASLAARRLQINPESTPQIIPAQALTLVAFLLMSLGCGLGALLGR
jgi:hypothetical protein